MGETGYRPIKSEMKIQIIGAAAKNIISAPFCIEAGSKKGAVFLLFVLSGLELN